MRLLISRSTSIAYRDAVHVARSAPGTEDVVKSCRAIAVLAAGAAVAVGMVLASTPKGSSPTAVAPPGVVQELSGSAAQPSP
jgi:hypothetical protein